jgi:hypothetical protein
MAPEGRLGQKGINAYLLQKSLYMGQDDSGELCGPLASCVEADIYEMQTKEVN